MRGGRGEQITKRMRALSNVDDMASLLDAVDAADGRLGTRAAKRKK